LNAVSVTREDGPHGFPASSLQRLCSNANGSDPWKPEAKLSQSGVEIEFVIQRTNSDLEETSTVEPCTFPTELVAFAMLVYISTKPDYDAVKKSWVLAGCLALALLLTLPFLLPGGQP
jgi:hypothetical protein